ncbi:MAG: hypothetical protein E7522_07755 [Ruminococcaceae bacterium]|nr:hypothetical protein [Oscillospiraceae bacterium]
MNSKMANNEIKTNAEIYREQRKERLEKASKKKHSAKKDKAVRIIIKTLAIILCVSLVGWFAGNLLLNVFNVPQKLLTVSTYDDEKLTGAEYNYYYMSLFNQIYQMAYEYESMYSSYGSGYGAYFTGFDMSKDPAEQEYPYDDAPEAVETWGDYFKEMASTRAFLMNAMYEKANSEEAKKEGFELTEDLKKEIQTEIDETIKSLEESASENDFALDNYIARVCGEGLSEKSYRALLEKDAVAQHYLAWYQEHLTTSYAKADVDSYFAENRLDFVTASARIFTVSYAEAEEGSTDPVYTKEQAKQRAEEFNSKVTSESSFIATAKQYAPPSMADSYASDEATLAADVYADEVSSNKAVTEWLFSSERVAGNKAVIEDSEGECYFVIYVVKPASLDESVANASVRHILIQVETEDAEGNALDEATIAKNDADAKAKAEGLLQTWKDNGATEEEFIKLIADNTDDTASIETDGLYDDVAAGGNYVAEFTNWAIDPARKAGDAEIVKTEFGYHFMYFVEASEFAAWENDVRETMASNDYNELVDGIYEDIEEKAEKNDTFLKFFSDRLEETISMRY